MMDTGQDFQQIYRRRFPEAGRQAKAAVWKVLVQDFFQRWVQPGDTVLDLGCGFGEFLNDLECGRKIGIDMNPDSAGYLNPGIEFHLGQIGDLAFLADGSVDVAFTSNVLEHLPGKMEIKRTLEQAKRVLAPGGHLIAMGSNIRFLPGRYWDFWDHLVPITDRSLSQVLELIGFNVVDCIPKFLPYTTCSRIPQKPWLVRWYLRLPIAWRLLGKQFLIRARKTGE